MIIRILYTALLCLVAPFLLYGLFRTKQGKPNVGNRWKEHFGFSPKLNSTSQPIWIHAVSVGETIAITPLIKLIKQKHPRLQILLTTTTPTGAMQAKTMSDLVEHRYMPVDFSFAIRSFIKRFSPSQLLIVETELWPNTLIQAQKAGIPVTIINARLSDKSYKNYQRILPLFKQCISPISKILCQYESDALRFQRLGIPKEKLVITGSIKFDVQITPEHEEKARLLQNSIEEKRPIWIASSTHQGEDEIILSAHKKILNHLPDALLILVPRHPERFSQVEKLSSERFETVTRTSLEPIHKSTQVYLGNTMGEMMTLISVSDVCFMGGSLLGNKVGGHNLLEPAILAKPILTGSSYYNFRDITDLLVDADACQIVTDAEDLANKLKYLLSHTDEANRRGHKASEAVRQSAGALLKTFNCLNLQ